MHYSRWLLILAFTLPVLITSKNSQGQPLNKQDMIEHVKRALQPVATTSYDSNYNAHYAGLTVAREQIKQADKSLLPAANTVVKNWPDYKRVIKRGFKNRANVVIDVFQMYTSMAIADSLKMRFSRALTQEFLHDGQFKTVAINRFSSNSLTLGEAVSQTQNLYKASKQSTPPDSAKIAKVLLLFDPAIAYYNTSKSEVHLVGTSRPEIINLRNQLTANQGSMSSLGSFELTSALTKLEAEMAVAGAINGAVRNNTDRAALVIDGEIGKSIYEVASKRGYRTRFFWVTKRTKEIEAAFSLK